MQNDHRAIQTKAKIPQRNAKLLISKMQNGLKQTENDHKEM